MSVLKVTLFLSTYLFVKGTITAYLDNSHFLICDVKFFVQVTENNK